MKGDMRYEVNEDWHVILYKRSMILDSIVLTSRTGEKDLAPLPLLLDDDDTTDPIVRMQTRRWRPSMNAYCSCLGGFLLFLRLRCALDGSAFCLRS